MIIISMSIITTVVLIVASLIYAKKKSLRKTIENKVRKSADDYFWNGYFNTYTLLYLKDVKGNCERLYGTASSSGGGAVAGLVITNV